MPKTRLGFYLHSPLLRNPSLLLRKMRERAGGGRPSFIFSQPPETVTCRVHTDLANLLRSWSGSLQLADESPTPYDVFGTRFAREDLLQSCRTIPDPGEGLKHDVKLTWEFSRFYSMPLRALLVDPANHGALSRTMSEEIREWLDFNEDPDGVNWTNAMEVAIRAINWVCADDLLNGRISASMGDETWKYWLWNHGRVIMTRLESRMISSNHYLANLLGLNLISSHLHGAEECEQWKSFSVREFPLATMGQSYGDGGIFEASLPYHALVTEMALLFLGANEPREPDNFTHHVKSMVQIVTDACRSSGDVFPVGDDDSGRIIAIDHIMKYSGRGTALLQLAEKLFRAPSTPALPSAWYPDSGWWIARYGDFHIMLECGGVGFAGKGAHAHNDTLSLCVDYNGESILIDPGSYLYSGSPAARNIFRSTPVHNTVVVDRQEQIALPPPVYDQLFFLPGPDQPANIHLQEPLAISVSYPHRFGLVMYRSVSLAQGKLEVVDTWEGRKPHDFTWCFHFSHGLEITSRSPREFIIKTMQGRMLTLSCDEVDTMEMADGHMSPGYGRKVSTKLLKLHLSMKSPRSFKWALAALPTLP